MPNIVRRCSSLGLLLLACGPGPLPPENPKTQPDTQAPLIAIEVLPSAATVTPAAPPKAAELPKPVVVIKDVGFETPECVLYLADSDVYLVANISGSPTAVDNNGFISKVNSDGSVADLKFIAGGQAGVQLDAPKGMVVVGDVLYVADISNVRRFDVRTGAAKAPLRFPKATFLNGIAADASGSLYVTDSGMKATPSGLIPNGSDAIYKVTGERVTVLAKGPALAGPNGIVVDGDTVVTVNLGNNQLTRFNAQGKVIATAELPSAGLDGLVALSGGNYLFSSWPNQAVYFGGFSGGFTVVASDLPSPAGIGFSEKHQRIAVPGFLGNDVRLIPFTAPSTPAAAPSSSAPAISAPAAVSPPSAVSPAASTAAAAAVTAPATSAKPQAASAPSASASTASSATPSMVEKTPKP